MGDGLTSEDITDVNELFKLWETDGKIKISDLGNVMRAYGMAPTVAELEAIEHEKEGQTELDMSDVMAIMSTQSKPNDPMSELRRAFQILDKDRKGYLDPKYFRQMMTELGDVLDEEEAEEIMRDMPTDAEGKINYEEFIFKVLNTDSK